MAPGTWETQDKARAALQRWLASPERRAVYLAQDARTCRVGSGVYRFKWRSGVHMPWRYSDDPQFPEGVT